MGDSNVYVNGKIADIIEIEEIGNGVVFGDTFDLDVRVCCDEDYAAHDTCDLGDPIPENRYLSISVTADAVYGSSMLDVVEGLIDELEKYKEGLQG